MAKVKMLRQISGTRDGKDWPAPGEYLTCRKDEAEDLVRMGMAVDEDAAKDEAATADKSKVETAVRGNKPVNSKQDKEPDK